MVIQYNTAIHYNTFVVSSITNVSLVQEALRNYTCTVSLGYQFHAFSWHFCIAKSHGSHDSLAATSRSYLQQLAFTRLGPVRWELSCKAKNTKRCTKHQTSWCWGGIFCPTKMVNWIFRSRSKESTWHIYSEGGQLFFLAAFDCICADAKRMYCYMLWHAELRQQLLLIQVWQHICAASTSQATTKKQPNQCAEEAACLEGQYSLLAGFWMKSFRHMGSQLHQISVSVVW